MSEIDYSTEVWKAIPGYEGRYSASSFGRIKSHVPWHGIAKYKPKNKLLRPALTQQGYLVVVLYPPKKTMRVHRLVLSAFVKPDPKRPHSNHKNGVKSDNRLENLEWCNRSENAIHRVQVLGKRCGNPALGEARTESKLTDAAVRIIRQESANGATRVKLAKRFKVSESSIKRVATGECWKHVI